MISETLGKRNSNYGIADAIATMRRIIGAAKRDGLVRTRLPCAGMGRPFEARCLTRVYGAAEVVMAELPDEPVVADTIGHADPRTVRDRCRRLLLQMVGPERLVVHLHDTQALGMANAYAAMEVGATAFDASVGGLVDALSRRARPAT